MFASDLVTPLTNNLLAQLASSTAGYKFYYQGWEQPLQDPSLYRDGCTKDNMFPSDRKGKLDGDLLKKMGLSKTRMDEKDALFFYQLLLPICDPSKSDIEGDPRKGFYVPTSRFTNLYAIDVKQRDGLYSNNFTNTNPEELVNFDGAVARSVNRYMGDCYAKEKENTYDPVIAENMHYRRFVDIKSCMKLCDHSQETKRGDDGYDPTQKYRLVWDVFVYNLNQFIEKADVDLTCDETSWSNESYADVQGGIKGKPGVSKGGVLIVNMPQSCCHSHSLSYLFSGQHTLLVGTYSRYVLAYTARHKFHPKVKGFTQEGPSEVKRLVEETIPLIKGKPKPRSDTRRQIFDRNYHVTLDNYFSGQNTLVLLGENNLGGMLTCRRDRLPPGTKKYLHSVKGVPVTQRSRCARYMQPVIASKHVPAQAGKPMYTLTHVSFQSTGGCNIQTVNSLNKVELYVRPKERGRGDQKRRWGIEMNQARQLYLGSYSAIDKIDQMVKNWFLYYITWRWWHAPVRHGKAIAMCMAYQMYKECAGGNLDPEFKVDVPMTAKEFRQQLATQMCQYRSSDNNYPGKHVTF